jgi:hypothetical protein
MTSSATLRPDSVSSTPWYGRCVASPSSPSRLTMPDADAAVT